MNKPRLGILTYAIIFFIFVIIGRFFYWQIIKSNDLKKNSLLQAYNIEIDNPSLGLIYSSDNFPLVQNQTVYQLSLYKPNFKKPFDEIITTINKVYPSFNENNQSLLNNFINNSNQKWITLPTLFNYEQQLALKDTAGLSFESLTKRYYPEISLSLNLLTGLESYYHRQLNGKSGFFRLSKDALGNALLLGSNWQSQSIPGIDLHLYLNRPLQHLVENKIRLGVEKYQADSGSITIMDPTTGGILAMASFTASPSSQSTGSAFPNPIISKLFEPGSIFKPLVVAAAIDAHSISADYICENCNRPHIIGQYTISNWDNELHPNSSLQDIIKNSDNIGMSHVIGKLGLSKFMNYFNLLGLGQKSGIDLISETKPVVKKNWSAIDLATASFGQGIAITQLQMLTAFNSLANKGILVKPSMIQKDPISTRVYQPNSVTHINNILKYAVENGTIAKLKPKGVEACAKSGTAQIALDGTYSSDYTIASYIGFSPCNEPKFTMIVTIDNPRTSPWGSSTAAPIWFDLAQIISNSPL